MNECRMNEWGNVYDDEYYTEWAKETMGMIQNELKRQWVLYRMNERDNGYNEWKYYREWMNETELMKETMGIIQNEWK